MMEAITPLYGATESTVWAGFETACRACGRRLAALSRRTAPREAPSEDAVRLAAMALLRALGCAVDERVTCSYCCSPKTRGRERYMDMASWEIRVDEGQSPIARAGWLTWPGDAEGDDGDA